MEDLVKDAGADMPMPDVSTVTGSLREVPLSEVYTVCIQSIAVAVLIFISVTLHKAGAFYRIERSRASIAPVVVLLSNTKKCTVPDDVTEDEERAKQEGAEAHVHRGEAVSVNGYTGVVLEGTEKKVSERKVLQWKSRFQKECPEAVVVTLHVAQCVRSIFPYTGLLSMHIASFRVKRQLVKGYRKISKRGPRAYPPSTITFVSQAKNRIIAAAPLEDSFKTILEKAMNVGRKKNKAT